MKVEFVGLRGGRASASRRPMSLAWLLQLSFALLVMCAGRAVAQTGLGADFGEASLAERRERASAARLDPAGVSWSEVQAAISDSDPLVRAELARLSAALELEGEAGSERLELLDRLARGDAMLEVRRAGLEALADLRSVEAAEQLLRLAFELAPDERSGAALHLVSFPRGRDLAFVSVRDTFRDGPSARSISSEVLAVLFSTYGRTLAEREGGGDQAQDRAPLVLGDSHFSPAVRAAAQRSLDTCLARLRELERYERADRLLARLAGDGMPARQILFLRARAGLAEGGVDPEIALAGARELGRTRGGPDAWTDQRWRFRALYLEGVALLALDRAKDADAALVSAGDLLDGLLERRVDETGERGAAEQRDLLHERALVEFTRAFGRVARGAPADDLALLETLRRAHQTQLEAQLVATEGDAVAIKSLDPLFDSALSPYRLIFAARPHAAWPPDRCLDIELALGRGLASISAREMPGFEPFGKLPQELSDPLLDPRRSTIMKEILVAEIGMYERLRAQVRRRRLEMLEDDSTLEQEEYYLSMVLDQLERKLKNETLEQRFYDLRLPGTPALRLAEGLRREGRNAESRVLGERLAAVLKERELPAQYSWAIAMEASAHMAVGGGWTDDDEPERAEEEMLIGLELFESLEAHFRERGDLDGARRVDANIADALVSLAVNANVKAGEAERALEYFERAYALEQGDFMSIMLACYRARSGHADEARELLAEIPESPNGYYNLSCTYAMLGESERALDLLERDFEENRRSAAALEKQKSWAREDPDLEALRDDPRFQFLTDPAPVPAVGEQE